MKDFLSFAAERYSVRKFKPDAVEDEKIEAILAAARVAPTACNYQPQKIYVVRSEEKRAALKALTKCTFDAPLVFVIGYDVERSAKGLIYPEHDFGDTDAAIACCHMMLEAHELGLGSCWVGWFNEKKLAAALGIPENVRIRELLPVGYPADDASPAPLHSKFRDMNDIAAYL